jgi:putative colanic acid biosynthesis acetyltransferase WcaF
MPGIPELGFTRESIVHLSKYDNHNFDRGRPRWVEALWLFVQALFVSSWLPGASHRRWFLKRFGARVGENVDLKPGLRVKFPWRLYIGDFVWVGEDAWIDNLADAEIGSHCCISQGTYLCTGSHDWSAPTFDLIVKPIRIENGAWIAARAVVGPGVTVGEGAVLGLGSVATRDLVPWTVYQGCPAEPVRERGASSVVGSERPAVKSLV